MLCLHQKLHTKKAFDGLPGIPQVEHNGVSSELVFVCFYIAWNVMFMFYSGLISEELQGDL